MNKKRLAKLGGTLFLLIGLLSLLSGNYSGIGQFIGAVGIFMAIGAWMLWVGFKKEVKSD